MNRAQKLKLSRELSKKQKQLIALLDLGIEAEANGLTPEYLAKVKALRDETLKMQNQLGK